MAKRIPAPTRVILALAKQLQESGKVWKGIGRKPIDEVRPSLIQELCNKTGLKRAAIHRVLAGQPRSARYQRLVPSADARGESVSQTVSHRSRQPSGALTPLPLGPTQAPARSITTSPVGGGASPPSSRDGVKDYFSMGKRDLTAPQEPMAPMPHPPKALMGRGLEAIGLRLTHSNREVERNAHIKADQAMAKEARRAAQDGIEWFLSVVTPPPAARRILEESLKVLSTYP
jgi:hypothetical protein